MLIMWTVIISMALTSCSRKQKDPEPIPTTAIVSIKVEVDPRDSLIGYPFEVFGTEPYEIIKSTNQPGFRLDTMQFFGTGYGTEIFTVIAKKGSYITFHTNESIWHGVYISISQDGIEKVRRFYEGGDLYLDYLVK